ncbi:MAG: hypothetical protein HY537_18815 [Deltaproteobacteria bacterium]|nr:hypothetical protein [Deltaproteobacteria bacterium]
MRLLTLFLMSFVVFGYAAAPQKPPSASEKPSVQGAIEPDYDEVRFFRYKTNLALGVEILKGSTALVTGAQLGYAPIALVPFYIGPEVSFALFSRGSLLNILAGGWYELRVFGAPRLSVVGGLVGGPGFSAQLESLPVTSFVLFIDTAIVQEVSDVATVRGQLRPGLVGGSFAFMVNFNLSFRFQ